MVAGMSGGRRCSAHSAEVGKQSSQRKRIEARRCGFEHHRYETRKGMRQMATNFTKELMVKPEKKVKLGKFDPDETLGWEKNRA